MNGFTRAICALATVAVAFALSAGSALADSPPTAPVEFHGELESGTTDTVQFTVPENGHYTASVRGNTRPVTLTLKGQPPFQPDVPNYTGGVLLPLTTYSLQVASSGATDYELDIAQVPPKLTNVSGHSAYTGLPGIVGVDYTLDVPAIVQPVLTSNQGQSIVLPEPYRMTPGTYGQGWELREADGTRVPDGFYSVSLLASNSAMGSPVPAGTVIFDTTAPTITLNVSGPDKTRAAVGITVRDPGPHPQLANDFGVAKVVLAVDGGPPKRLTMTDPPYPTERDSYTVPGGVWGPGPHIVVVAATDFLGNTSMQSVTFSVPVPYKPTNRRPSPCSTLAIKTAVRSAKPFNAALRRIGALPHGDVFHRFLIAGRSCTELTHDTGLELVVLLREQRGTKTALAIFTRTSSGWRFVFQDAKHQIDSIDQLNSDVVENLHPKPRHKARQLRVHWTGSRYVLRRLS